MKTTFTLFLLTILALTLGACAGSGGSTNLAGTFWNLTAINGQPIVPGSAPTLVFDKEQATGNGSCNSFGGDYTASGGSLSFGSLMSTMMACMDNGISEQETAYFSALASAAKYEVKDGRLIIFDGDGKEILSFEQQK